MFQDVHGRWHQYWVANLAGLQSSPLWALAGEVEARLEQLDMLLDHATALEAQLAERPTDLGVWGQLVLFHECFYFVAWRLIEVWNRRGEFRFPALHRVTARGVRDVRNQLMEHPENHEQLFGRFYVATDDGVAMKALKTVTDPETGREMSAPENLDRGFHANVRELHDALLRSLDQCPPNP